MNILFLTKQEIVKTGENEQKKLAAIMAENGYKNGYGGTRIMVDDVILDEEYPPQAIE